jgi:hypothetical protein
MLCIIMQSAVMLIVVMRSVGILSIVILSVVILSVVMLSVIVLRVVMLSVIMLIVVILSVIMLIVVAPKFCQKIFFDMQKNKEIQYLSLQFNIFMSEANIFSNQFFFVFTFKG